MLAHMCTVGFLWLLCRMKCDKHGHSDIYPFDVRINNLDLWPKVTFEPLGKEQQLQSIAAKLQANCGPLQAQQEVDYWAEHARKMHRGLNVLGFNWHGKGNSAQTCTLQVVCRACGMSTEAMHPFWWDHDLKQYSGEAMIEFAEELSLSLIHI